MYQKVPCRACRKEVYTDAEVCPECGVKTPNELTYLKLQEVKNFRRQMGQVLGVVLALIGLYRTITISNSNQPVYIWLGILVVGAFLFSWNNPALAAKLFGRKLLKSDEEEEQEEQKEQKKD